jgi:Glycosyl hydrolase family 26
VQNLKSWSSSNACGSLCAAIVVLGCSSNADPTGGAQPGNGASASSSAGAANSASGVGGNGGNAGIGGTASGGASAGGASASGSGGMPAGSNDGSAGAMNSNAVSMPATLRTLTTSQYVSVAADGTLSAASSSAGTAEAFTLNDLNGGSLMDGDEVQLKASTGKYLSAANGGGTTVAATADQATDDETFVISRIAGAAVIASGDEVAFKAKTSAYYLSADQGGGGAVLANETHAEAWETFTLTLNDLQPPVPPASDAKQKVLAYFSSISGKQTIFGVENKGTLHDDTDHVASVIGKQPGFWGNDFGFGSDAVSQRPAMATEAINQWKAGAVVALMYHACAPTRDENCDWDQVGGATPQHLTDAQWSDLVTPGTDLYQAWIGRLDALSVVFQTLKDAGVAPLFRPFHEMNQCVFWWSCHTGDNGSQKLYQITHDYLVNTKGFDNIIWVWNVQDFDSLASDVTTYSPGSAYFDIAALDVYNTGYTSGNYNAMLGAAGGKFVAVAECQFMPSQAILTQQPKWLYAMLWPDFYANNDLATLYSAPSVLTEDEMPGW